MEKYIYPNIEVLDSQFAFELRTTLRKEKNGIWYDWNHVSTLYKEPNKKLTCDDKIKFLNKFHSQVYATLMIGIIDENLTVIKGEKLFEKSESQITEKERIKLSTI